MVDVRVELGQERHLPLLQRNEHVGQAYFQ